MLMTTTVKITGMTCGHCVAAVKSALQAVPGIKSFDVKIGEATVESEGTLDSAVVKHAIEEEGYEVVSVG
jgi:copper chaperone